MNFFYRMLCGFFLGVSVVAPGVSGSVMAVMMGIYRDLIKIISNPFKNLKKNFFYLLPMGIGAILSLAVFVKLLSFLFENYPAQSRFLFMGLIAGGLPTMFRQARGDKFKRQHLTGTVIAFAVAGTVGLLARLSGDTAEVGNISMIYLCISGLVAGASSMVPGMSVSMILMLFGVYDFLLKAASGFTSDIMYTVSIAAPVGICFVAGMVAFSNLTKIVFEKHERFAYSMVLGFMCGTLTAIFPNTMPDTYGGFLGCIIMFIAGLYVSGVFEYLGKKFHVDE